VVEIENFGYKDRYTVLLLKEDEKEVSKRAEKHFARRTKMGELRKMHKNAIHGFNGSEGLRKERGIRTRSEGGKKRTRDGNEMEYVTGGPIVFYQNSVISRGLDVDQYSLMLVYDCSFAQPLVCSDKNVANAIISDETTIRMRISPTHGGMKAHESYSDEERDWWKVKYLEGRERLRR